MSGVCWSAAIAVAVEPANVSNKRNAKGCLNVFIMVLRCFNTEMLSHSTAKLEAFQARIPELRMTFWPYTKELPDGFRANCVNICEYNWIYNIYTYIYIYKVLHPHRIWNWNFGFPGHPWNWTWKTILRIQLTSKNLYSEYRWTISYHINSFTCPDEIVVFFNRISALFFINPSRFHTNSSLFQIFAI